MKKQRLFPLAETQMLTLGALSVLAGSRQNPARFVLRHLAGDFGAISEEEKQKNANAIKTGDGSPIISKYVATSGEAIWVITESGITMVVTPFDRMY
jgi:hypothetical protein